MNSYSRSRQRWLWHVPAKGGGGFLCRLSPPTILAFPSGTAQLAVVVDQKQHQHQRQSGNPNTPQAGCWKFSNGNGRWLVPPLVAYWWRHSVLRCRCLRCRWFDVLFLRLEPSAVFKFVCNFRFMSR
jgi:hypothetical protein